MGVDYGEILCNAVDQIISTRIQGLSYDITKLCTIVDDTYSNQGKYKVSDGTAKYDAFSTDNNLKKGNSVLVTIPNGDYSMQKTIKGRVAAIDTTPFNYTSPLDTMISLKDDVLDAPQTGENQKKSLTANDPLKTIIGPIYSIKDASGLSGFTRLGISADFKSTLSGLDVAKGTYGIKLIISSESLEKPGTTKEVYYTLDFNSADMIGNPYQFEDYFAQEKVYDISYIDRIKGLDVYFYQNNDFKDGNGNLISYDWSTGEDIDWLIQSYSTIDNLFVDNVKVYLGYDINEFKDETLLIYTNDTLSYHYSKEETHENRKLMELRWIHKLEDGKHFTILSNSNFDADKYSIKWFRYSQGNESLDKYAKKDWEQIDAESNNPFKCEFFPDVKKQKEQIKVIGLIKDTSQEVKKGEEKKILETPYFSNLLIFENEEYVPDQKTQDASTALSIYCKDDSEGNYFLYDQNGKINNQGIGQGYTRTFQALFNGATITSALGTLDWIRWYFPYDEKKNSSMLLMQGHFTDEEVKDRQYIYRGVNYYVVERKPKEAKDDNGNITFTSDEQDYSIANQWDYKNSNNTVICRVSIDGVEYEAIEELRFGKAGSNGTNTTLVLEFDNNKNALIAEEGNTIDVSLIFYNSEGQQAGFSGTADSIKWSWYKHNLVKDENGEESEAYMDFEVNNEVRSRVTITCKTNNVPTNNYYILQATHDGMTAFLPIPIKDKSIAYLEGAREVIYNHQGIPSYYNGNYKLFEYKSDTKLYTQKQGLTWGLKCGNTNDNNYMPKLKEKDGGQALSAAIFYTSGENEEVCVYAQVENDKCYWAQPILIMQSRYDFAMLNDWDGSLTLKEDNSTVLAAMLGAGRKDSGTNTFSGVLIGDIKTGTGNESANEKTGVYGIQKGVISYSLTEDGRATLGANGNGQIIIDSSESVIKTKGYDEGIADNNGKMQPVSGMKIDLNDGLLDIRNANHKSLIHLSAGLTLKDENNQIQDNPYFLINTQKGNTLIRIDDNDYYLQSNNYSSTSGSKFNLATGEIKVNGELGQVSLLTKDDSTYKNTLFSVDCYLDSAQSKKSRLIQIGKDDYFLQSKSYSTREREKVYDKDNGEEVGDLYLVPGMSSTGLTQGNIVDGSSRYVTILDRTKTVTENNITKNVIVKDFYEANQDNGKYYKGGQIIFNAVTEDYKGASESGTGTLYSSEDNKQRFFNRAILQYKGENENYKGFKLDMNNNMIIGYDLRITAYNQKDPTKSIIIDSGNPSCPLRIGNNFSVDWDGNVYCHNPAIDGKGGSINLGKFYFNSSGAGGGQWNGNSVGVSGYGAGKITSGGETNTILILGK